MNRLRVLLFALGMSLLVAGLYHGFYYYQAQQALCRTNSPAHAYQQWMVFHYGDKKYSQHNEELIIRDFFDDQINGVFVDVGSSHFRTNSTTYYLEKNLNWRGVAIDAIKTFEDGYLENRPNTKFFSFYVSDESDRQVDFYINLHNDRLSSGLKSLAEKQGKFREQMTYSITLNDLLNQLKIDRIDFLSMDIELAEPAALAGFDINRYRPDLVCVEAHPEVRDEILKYFQQNNYKVIEKYRELDPLNFYFTPVQVNR